MIYTYDYLNYSQQFSPKVDNNIKIFMIFYFLLHDHLLAIFVIRWNKMVRIISLLFRLPVVRYQSLPGFFACFDLVSYRMLIFINKEYCRFYQLTFLVLLWCLWDSLHLNLGKNLGNWNCFLFGLWALRLILILAWQEAHEKIKHIVSQVEFSSQLCIFWIYLWPFLGLQWSWPFQILIHIFILFVVLLIPMELSFHFIVSKFDLNC